MTAQIDLLDDRLVVSSADSPEFYTPPWLHGPIGAAVGGWDIDPATTGDNPVGAARTCVGRAGEVRAGRARLVVMLLQLPALGSRYAFAHLRDARVGVIEGRVHFVNGGGVGGMFPSMLVALGDPVLTARVIASTRTPAWPRRHQVWWMRECQT